MFNMSLDDWHNVNCDDDFKDDGDDDSDSDDYFNIVNKEFECLTMCFVF